MARANLVMAIAIIFPFATCSFAEEASDIDKWIEQLGSEDFDVRETAATELGKRSEKIWDRLEKLTKSDNADVRTLARRAMGDAGKRALKVRIDAIKSEIAAQAKATLDAQDAVKKAYEDQAAMDAPLRDAIEKRIIDPSEANKEKEAAAEKAKAAAADRVRKARTELDALLKSSSARRAILDSKLDQFKLMLTGSDVILPADVVDWKPERMPFDKRLKSKVTFEFVDTTLEDALKFFKEVCGLGYEIDPRVKDSPTINLRVTEMEADLSLQWISKLVDLEYSVDPEARKVHFRKGKRQE